jgi:hypothetical protein
MAAVLAAVLFIPLPEQMTFGPGWAPLVLVVLLLVPLFSMQAALRRPGGWQPDPRLVRRIALTILGLLALAEAISLALLLAQLPSIHAGALLFRSAALIWGINLLVFSLCYWELDGGGPARRPRTDYPPSDFLFPQHTDARLNAGWSPSYVDYLFLAFNTATAFSPTDTMVLSRAAKGVMMAQSLISLLTVGLVVARGVNVL